MKGGEKVANSIIAKEFAAIAFQAIVSQPEVIKSLECFQCLNDTDNQPCMEESDMVDKFGWISSAAVWLGNNFDYQFKNISK